MSDEKLSAEQVRRIMSGADRPITRDDGILLIRSATLAALGIVELHARASGLVAFADSLAKSVADVRADLEGNGGR